MIAESIIGASKELDIRVPMVVRLQGTNSAEGLRLVSSTPSTTKCRRTPCRLRFIGRQSANIRERLTFHAQLAEANLGLHVESDFGRAAQRVVELAKAA